ncbi:MAG: hypothetical protein ACFFAL_01390 [Promethearchaeota archaeon]|jgi:hypothetical protein|nr:hypothetical protein [Candidatus Hermodarchaeota archaeon]
MSNETAGTLALVGGILNLIGGIIIAIIFLFTIILIPLGILALLLGILPIMWRDDPGSHRVGLIIIGVLTLFSIGGILILIAGIIAEEEKA